MIEKPSKKEYKNENYSEIIIKKCSKNTNYSDDIEVPETEEAAPIPFNNINFNENNENIINNKCDCYEMDKLLLTNSTFIYKSRINKNDFYRIFIKKNIEVKVEKIMYNKNRYDKFKNLFHYNFINLLDYVEEVKEKLKSRRKNKLNFTLDLKFKCNKKLEHYDENKQNNLYNFDISCQYNFFYKDKSRDNIIKKHYMHNNIFDEIEQLNIINKIFSDFENVLDRIQMNIINDKEIGEMIPEKKKEKTIKINKLKNFNFNLINFKEEIDRHVKSVQMIRELSCGKFVSCGLDGKIILIDENQEKKSIDSNKIIDNWIYSIAEVPDTENEFIACCPEKIYIIFINNNKFEVEEKRLNFSDSLNLYAFYPHKEELILCGSDSLSKYNGIIKEIKEDNQKSFEVLNKIQTRCGINISGNIIAVVSNKVLKTKGQDILKCINKNRLNEPYSEEYSFNIGPNSLLIIDTNIDVKNNNSNNSGSNKRKRKQKNNNTQGNNEKAKLLLCACTKYLNDQKNGILIICPNSKKIKNNFYDTGDFEVFCFCNLKTTKVDKSYILVGGYDNQTSRGLIKLYEIIYDDNNRIENTSINFIRNIHNLSKFKQPFNCIIQSSKTGNIIATNFDGSINLFSKPNID